MAAGERRGEAVHLHPRGRPPGHGHCRGGEGPSLARGRRGTPPRL